MFHRQPRGKLFRDPSTAVRQAARHRGEQDARAAAREAQRSFTLTAPVLYRRYRDSPYEEYLSWAEWKASYDAEYHRRVVGPSETDAYGYDKSDGDWTRAAKSFLFPR
ncbi:hypothetical protein GCM10023147_36010 [Tsukamurella soli]|uniref:Uncharacterized protein n=1 Tax=Tsukamurella soli TaxID=644556 RepID=A0ABP8K1H0_9ACTN